MINNLWSPSTKQENELPIEDWWNLSLISALINSLNECWALTNDPDLLHRFNKEIAKLQIWKPNYKEAFYKIYWPYIKDYKIPYSLVLRLSARHYEDLINWSTNWSPNWFKNYERIIKERTNRRNLELYALEWEQLLKIILENRKMISWRLGKDIASQVQNPNNKAIFIPAENPNILLFDNPSFEIILWITEAIISNTKLILTWIWWTWLKYNKNHEEMPVTWVSFKIPNLSLHHNWVFNYVTENWEIVYFLFEDDINNIRNMYKYR